MFPSSQSTDEEREKKIGDCHSLSTMINRKAVIMGPSKVSSCFLLLNKDVLVELIRFR